MADETFSNFENPCKNDVELPPSEFCDHGKNNDNGTKKTDGPSWSNGTKKSRGTAKWFWHPRWFDGSQGLDDDTWKYNYYAQLQQHQSLLASTMIPTGSVQEITTAKRLPKKTSLGRGHDGADNGSSSRRRSSMIQTTPRRKEYYYYSSSPRYRCHLRARVLRPPWCRLFVKFCLLPIHIEIMIMINVDTTKMFGTFMIFCFSKKRKNSKNREKEHTMYYWCLTVFFG